MLVDGVLALDAGSVSSGLSLEEQNNVRAILLTHRHFDHVRDLLTLGLATMDSAATIDIYGLEETLRDVREYLVNGKLYPDFARTPSVSNPKYRFQPIEPYREESILDYRVMPVPVPHGPPSVGYMVNRDGAGLFYTGDAGRGLAASLVDVAPDLLIVETTFSNRWKAKASEQGHMTPRVLEQELASFSQNKGYLPRVLAVHMHPAMEADIRSELRQVAQQLNLDLTLGVEDMVVEV